MHVASCLSVTRGDCLRETSVGSIQSVCYLESRSVRSWEVTYSAIVFSISATAKHVQGTVGPPWPQLVSYIQNVERLSAGERVYYGRFHCSRHDIPWLLHTQVYKQ